MGFSSGLDIIKFQHSSKPWTLCAIFENHQERMDYTSIVEQINVDQNRSCFKKPEQAELEYLRSLNLPNEVLNFYCDYNPIDTIELNDIRLLPISEIIAENTNYTPGYLLTPLGFCVIASTIEGDVYCIQNIVTDYKIVIASHDEIYEGQETEELLSATKEVSINFIDFLNSFIEGKLVVSYYDLEK